MNRLRILKPFKFFYTKLKGNLFFQNVVIISGGTIVAKLITILSAPIITRLYTPDDYGILTIFGSFIGITGSLSTLRYAVTIPLAKDDNLADNLHT